MNKNDFYCELDKFTLLPGIIDSLSIESFRKVQLSEEAKSHKNIVYVWRTQQKFQRFHGESDVLYIGQTKQSFYSRYKEHSKSILTAANSLKYRHAIETYGGIRISVCSFEKFGATLKEAEGQLLWWYFQNHYEYPPINYTKTKIRYNDFPQNLTKT